MLSPPTAVCCLALLAATSLCAQDPILSPAYDHFYNLEYDQAIADFTSAAKENPTDPNAWNHLAQGILFRAMYRSGALESEMVSGSNPFLRRSKVRIAPADDISFFDAIDKAMLLSQARLHENPDDAAGLGALGVAYALRGNYNFLVRKAWVDALHDATDARKAHKRLCELEPDNIDAQLIPATYDYVTGSLPLGYRILGFITGYHGDRNRGIRTLQSVAQNGRSSRADAETILAAIYRRERRAQDAIPLLQDLIRRFPRNYLMRFEIVQMYSDLGNKSQALAEIDRIWELQQSGAPGYRDLPAEKIDYLQGNMLFWYDDLIRAVDHLKKAAAKGRTLDLNTAIMAYMRLGQTYDLEGRRALAIAAYRKAVALAPQSDVAKESRAYVTKPYRRKVEQTSVAGN
jgi:tetratricopeptide (TPR) repeat protein